MSLINLEGRERKANGYDYGMGKDNRVKCWFFHKWSAWKRIELMVVYHIGGVKKDEFKRDSQERICSRCGKIQRAKL